MEMFHICIICLQLLSIQTVLTAHFNPNEISNLTKFNRFIVEHHDLDKTLYDPHMKYCKKTAKCQLLNYTTCMGAKLPYQSTTLELTDLTTQEKVQERLQLYQHLRYVPKCWSVIQPFLCALYMPKCDNNKVDLPSKEMCRITLEPCKLFYNSSIFPKFLNCEDETVFPSKCKNDVHELKFNTTGFCMEPLVKTDQIEWFYPDVEGCGLRCKDSLYTDNEHYQIHHLIAYSAPIGGTLNLFAMITFFIDWKTANKYPALTIFYMNLCILVYNFGWWIQSWGGETREDIVCKKDGTLRKSEPSATENLSCVIVFVLIYYFLIAAIVWFVILSYTWYMNSLQALGKIDERVDKKKAYFHLVAWSTAMIFTITTMALGEIDGDYVTGICFVGSISFLARFCLLLAPLGLAMVIATTFIIRGLILLIKVKNESREIISEHSRNKIRSSIVRMGVTTFFIIIFSVITFIYHGYVYVNRDEWAASLRNYIMCKLTSLHSDYSHCKQDTRPSVAMLQLQLFASFGASLVTASWVCCEATVHSWTRYLRKKFRCEIEEPMKLQKHKIIAIAFAKRKKFNEGGRISIECQNYTDPVGLHFDLNSVVSNSLSTTWAANLPRLINRRGAMVNDMAYSLSSNNQSIDSEVSLNVRHVSIESRCNSGDSQLSVQIAELKATRKVNRRNRHRKRIRHKHSTNRSESVRRPSKSKNGSSTSLDSHLKLMLKNLTNTSTASTEPNLERRPGIAGIDGQHINKLLSNGKLVIPFNRNDINNKSENEDENVSVTISESRFNMVLSNNLDLNDQLVMQSLGKSLRIEEIDTSSDSDDDDDDESKQLKDNVSKEKRYSRNGRDSRLSKRSKRSRISRKTYNSNTDDSGGESDSELNDLLS